MSEAATLSTGDARRIGAIRIGIGLAQGVAVWALVEAGKNGTWPSTEPGLFGALALTALFAPLVVLGGVTALRGRTLAIWTLFAAAVLAGLGFHDLARRGPLDDYRWISATLTAGAAAGLFIAHHLVEGGDAERRLIARYPRYFDIAWKHGVQIALSAGFVGVFWIVLLLGGAMFNLIGIRFVSELIEKSWFFCPATATMFAAAIHLTDVRGGLIRGIRSVALTLLSWLLPVLAVLVAAFLAALPFTGLDPLWKTRSAAGILLSAAAVLIVLLNAAYQDGEPEGIVPLPLRAAGRLGGLLLAPLIGLAIYALWLRISQYGLSVDRVVASACALVGAVYAVGYAWAAIRLGRWMRRLEVTNVAAAFVVLAVLAALFSPLGDPRRLAVSDQLTRLRSGKTPAAKFDYAYLRFQGGRYGDEALKALEAEGGDIGGGAAKALALRERWERPSAPSKPLAERIAVWPRGTSLPAGFLEKDWRGADGPRPGCLIGNADCDARLADIDGDGRNEVLLLDDGGLFAFGQQAGGEWRSLGSYASDCGEGVLDAETFRRDGVGPAPSHWKALEFNGRRFEFRPSGGDCDAQP